MSPEAKRILAEALKLPRRERALFAHLLLLSLDPPDGMTEAQWQAELTRRWHTELEVIRSSPA